MFYVLKTDEQIHESNQCCSPVVFRGVFGMGASDRQRAQGGRCLALNDSSRSK
jgi:hypothetical protein